MLSQLKNLFLDEASRWVLWLPVFLGLGIALFFSYGQNVSEKSAFAAVSMAVSLFALNRKRPIARYVAIITLTIAIGFAAAKFRTEFVKAPIIPVINSPITLSGNIAEISYSTGFPVLILENLRIDNLDKRYIPKKIRLNVRTKIRDEIRPGIGLSQMQNLCRQQGRLSKVAMILREMHIISKLGRQALLLSQL